MKKSIIAIAFFVVMSILWGESTGETIFLICQEKDGIYGRIKMQLGRQRIFI